MKLERPRFARASLLLTAAACLATPVLAQDQTTPTVNAPPAAPPQAAPTPVPQVSPPPATDQSTNVSGGQPGGNAGGQTSDVPGADKNSTTPIDPGAAQGAREEAEAAREARRNAAPRRATAPARAARPTQTTRTTTTTATQPAATPTPAATPSPAASATPAADTESDALTNAAAVDANAAPANDTALANDTGATTDEAVTNTTETTQAGGFPWLWVILGVIVLAGVGFFFLRRRSAESEYQPVYGDAPPVAPVAPVAQPAAAPAPIVPPAPVAPVPPVVPPIQPLTDAPAETVLADTGDVAPVAAEDATLAEPEAADVAALTAATPAGERPWLELALRPLRAGTNVDEALVEVELTVANAGSVAADDVRIATYLLPAASEAEVARVLDTPPSDAAVEPRSIAPGEGAAVNATLALPRAGLAEAGANAFQPVVVADVRYRLGDGSEGRTSAAFEIGGVGEGGFAALDLERPLIREDVEARLYGQATRV